MENNNNHNDRSSAAPHERPSANHLTRSGREEEQAFGNLGGELEDLQHGLASRNTSSERQHERTGPQPANLLRRPDGTSNGEPAAPLPAYRHDHQAASSRRTVPQPGSSEQFQQSNNTVTLSAVGTSNLSAALTTAAETLARIQRLRQRGHNEPSDERLLRGMERLAQAQIAARSAFQSLVRTYRVSRGPYEYAKELVH